MFRARGCEVYPDGAWHLRLTSETHTVLVQAVPPTRAMGVLSTFGGKDLGIKFRV